MQKILEPILVTIIFVGSYILNYSCFDICLSDDVEFNYGKHKKRKIYKETHGFWRKFFFIDIRKMVSRWHYVLFIVNFTAFCSSAYFDKRLCVERGKRVQVVVSYLLRSLHSVVCPGSICKMGTLQRKRCQKPQEVQKE